MQAMIYDLEAFRGARREEHFIKKKMELIPISTPLEPWFEVPDGKI